MTASIRSYRATSFSMQPLAVGSCQPCQARSVMALMAGAPEPSKPKRPITTRYPIAAAAVAALRRRGGIHRAPAKATQRVALHVLPSAGTGKALGRIGDTGWFPADCALAVGKTDLVAAVNGEVAVFNRSGKRLGAETLNAFFGSVRGGLAAFDPRAVFDPHSERFFVIAVARSDDGAPRQSMVLIAVSKTAAARDGFDVYGLDASEAGGARLGTLWADFPTLGVDSRGLYIGLNMFPWDKDTFGWARVLAFRKEDVLRGEFSGGNFSRLKDPDGTASFTIFPCRTFGDPPKQYLVSTQIKDSGVSRKLVLWTISWDRRGQPSLDSRAVGVLSYHWPPEGEQPDGSAIDSGDVRLGDAVCRSGLVHACFTSAQGGRAAVQWVQIDAVSGKVRQQGVLGDESLSLAYPSLQPTEDGTLKLCCTAVGPDLPLSIAVAERRVTDPDGGFGAVRLAVAGKASQQEKGQRWGDYTGMAADPADPKTCLAHAPLNRSGKLWETRVIRV